MSIFVIGVNHKTAPVNLREKIYFALDKLSLYLQDLLNRGIAEEAVLLSTCNRSELYCRSHDVGGLRDWFCEQTTCSREELESAIYIYRNEDAVTHIMQVACGLDSMIVGEPQILGQMKEAFSESCAANAVSTSFHQLFQHVFSTAKDIRTTTAIGACPVSVASAAVHFAKQKMPAFNQANVVLIGAGETAELMMRYLQTHLASPPVFVNRNILKAAELADEFGGRAYGLAELPEVLSQADIVFSATGAPVPVVTKAIVAEAMRERENTPLMLIDIAVPRDIDPEAGKLPNVSLSCIDDLKSMIETNRHGREHAADKAREMIRQKSEKFIAEMNSFARVSHTISAYRGVIEDICRAELLKAKHQLGKGIDPEQVLETFAYTFTNKLLHTPSVQLRQAGVEGRFELLRIAKQLFAIPDPEVERL